MVNEQRGFTILEVLVAIALFAFGMIALFRLQISVIQNNSLNNESSQVMALVQSRMEDLLALDYDNTDLADSNNNGENGLNNGLNLNKDGAEEDESEESKPPDHTENYGSYTLSWNIAIDLPITNTKSIRLIASWTDKRNVDHRIVMNCVKANN
jgi:prepilin-type N-terminal cleavage/methylation domain-containing protein